MLYYPMKPRGGFVNDSEVTQMTLVGNDNDNITIVVHPFRFIHTFTLYRCCFYNSCKVIKITTCNIGRSHAMLKQSILAGSIIKMSAFWNT